MYCPPQQKSERGNGCLLELTLEKNIPTELLSLEACFSAKPAASKKSILKRTFPPSASLISHA
jgi:hypothetical protein